MNRPLLLQSVLLRLRRYKLKTLVMALGIAVGVLATVLLQTVADSVHDAFVAFIERAYPSDGVVLVAGTGFMGSGSGRNNLLLSEVETVANTIGVTQWDPVVYAGTRDVKRGSNSVRVMVAGYSEKAETVRRRSAADGEFFDADDVRSRAHVALIGATTAATLFPGESPIGAELFIDNVPFEVKGVLERAGADPHGNDQDNAIWVPHTTLMSTFRKSDNVSAATFIVGGDRTESVKQEIADVMHELHGTGKGEDDDFTVITPVFMRSLFDKSFRTFTIFVPLIAGTVFVIAAVVILAIMQISIKGRTREIGLRKAVGARAGDVQTQVVLEVLLISAGAALLGVALAELGCLLLAPFLAEKFGVRHVSPSALVLLIAVGAATLTGLVGGVIPARRAARLHPVEALR
jgi:putative ABC transport system permease protein